MVVVLIFFSLFFFQEVKVVQSDECMHETMFEQHGI